MTLSDAYKQIVPFGQFKGRSLLDVAKNDITYLVWLRDKAVNPVLSEALRIICDANTREIAEAIDRREREQVQWQYRKAGW